MRKPPAAADKPAKPPAARVTFKSVIRNSQRSAAADSRRSNAAARRAAKPAPPPKPRAATLSHALAKRDAVSLTAAQRRAVDDLFSQLSRTEIAQTLQRSAICQSDADLQRVINLLADDAFDAATWPTLCRRANIPPAKLFNAVVETYIADGSLLIARQYPRIAQRLADQSLDQVLACWACDGKGTVTVRGDGGAEEEAACGNGCVQGRLFVPASHKATELALGILGVDGKAPGPLIAQQFVNQPGSGNGGGRGGQQQPVEEGVPDMSDWAGATDREFEDAAGTAGAAQ